VIWLALAWLAAIQAARARCSAVRGMPPLALTMSSTAAGMMMLLSRPTALCAVAIVLGFVENDDGGGFAEFREGFFEMHERGAAGAAGFA
jgi:hypothetical protein